MIRMVKRTLLCICAVLIIINSIIGSISFADEEKSTLAESFESSFTSEEDDGGIAEGLGEIMSGWVGLITWIPRAILVGGVTIVQTITGTVAKMAGTAEGETVIALTPDDILFNKITLTDINFFSTEGLDGDNPIKTIREQIALWYYVIRAIAIIILLVILIIVGIRMAITTVASEKAIYKKALFDWLTSFVLVFFLHYVIRLILWINDALVDILNPGEVGKLTEVLDAFKVLLFHPDFIVGVGALILYVMITIQTLMFLVSYIKRMLTLAFLIIISPLITITYSIDKMGDQKAQALNNWLKEFIYNVLIQPFHCILYLAFVTTAIATIAEGGIGNLASVILAVICIHFVWSGEKIVNKIFGFGEASSLATAAASGAIIGSMIGKAKSAGSNIKSGVKFASNSKTGQLLKQKYNDRKTERKDLKGLSYSEKKDYKQAKKNNDNTTMDSLKDKAKENRAAKEKARASKPIHQIKNNIKDRMDNPKGTIGKAAKTLKNSAKSFANSDLGKALGSDAKKFVRKIARPENIAKVSAAVMAGAAMYALPDSNLVTAVGAGYAAGKSAETGVRNLKQRKKENYEENVLKAWDRHCAINNVSAENRTKDKFNDWYNNTYLKGENMDAYSVKNMNKQEKDTSKDLETMGLARGDIDSIIAQIQKAILAKQDYDPSKMFEGYYNKNTGESISADEIAKAVQGYASKYNESTVYQNASAYNDQMNPLGITHEDAIGGISDKEIRGNNESIEDYREYVTEDFEEARSRVGDDKDTKEIFRQLEGIVNDKMDQINQEVNRLSSELNSSLGATTSSNIINQLQSSIDTAMSNATGDLQSEIDRAIDSMKSQLGSNEGTARAFATQYVEQIKTTKEKRFVELVEERKTIRQEVTKMVGNKP